MATMGFRAMIRSLVLAACGALTVASPLPAAAYTWGVCDDGDDRILWEEDEGAACNGCVSMGINTVSFTPDGVWDRRLMQAMGSWNAIERSTAEFSYWRDSDGTYGTNNGENEIVFDHLDDTGSTLAVTRLIYNGGWGDCILWEDSNISEADIVFDVDQRWYTSRFQYRDDLDGDGASDGVNFLLVAVHELGHALGLRHEDDRLDRMNSFYPAGGCIARSRQVRPLADARRGMRALYPEEDVAARPDLVASNYKRTGSGTSGLVSGPTSASRGSSVSLQYTYMNNGSANAGEFAIGFYLSSNDRISTSDRRLGTSYSSGVRRGRIRTRSRSLTIPADVTPGTYYLGFLVDKDGQVSERDETNNDLAQPRRLTIY